MFFCTNYSFYCLECCPSKRDSKCFSSYARLHQGMSYNNVIGILLKPNLSVGNGARPARVLMKGPMPCTHAAPQLLCSRSEYADTTSSCYYYYKRKHKSQFYRPLFTAQRNIINDNTRPNDTPPLSFHSVKLWYGVLPLNYRNSVFLVFSSILSRGRPLCILIIDKQWETEVLRVSATVAKLVEPARTFFNPANHIPDWQLGKQYFWASLRPDR